MRGISNTKTATEIEVIREAAKISTEIMQKMRSQVAVGVTPKELDEYMRSLCIEFDVKPAFKGVPNASGGDPFPANLCICVNDAILHGIPSSEQLAVGDLIKLDLGIIHKGYYTDHCTTVAVKELLPEDESLLKVGKLAVDSAVDKVGPGVTTGVLGNTMEKVATMAGFDVLKEYVGHGIGSSLWEPPQIPAYGEPYEGDVLEPGMVISVEAQIVAGNDEVYVDEDDWTVRTVDGSKGVMFEYMVLVTEEGAEILTNTRDWPLVA